MTRYTPEHVERAIRYLEAFFRRRVDVLRDGSAGRQWSREYYRYWQKLSIAKGGLGLLSNEFADPTLGFNDAVITKLIDRADNRDEDAQIVLREAIVELLVRDESLPDILCDYAVQLLRGEKKVLKNSGSNPHEKSGRRAVLALGVYQMTRPRWGFNPTRNQASRDKDGAAESGCSLAVKALKLMEINIGEDAVQDAWKASPGFHD